MKRITCFIPFQNITQANVTVNNLKKESQVADIYLLKTPESSCESIEGCKIIETPSLKCTDCIKKIAEAADTDLWFIQNIQSWVSSCMLSIGCLPLQMTQMPLWFMQTISTRLTTQAKKCRWLITKWALCAMILILVQCCSIGLTAWKTPLQGWMWTMITAHCTTCAWKYPKTVSWSISTNISIMKLRPTTESRVRKSLTTLTLRTGQCR